MAENKRKRPTEENRNRTLAEMKGNPPLVVEDSLVAETDTRRRVMQEKVRYGYFFCQELTALSSQPDEGFLGDTTPLKTTLSAWSLGLPSA